MLTLFDHSSTVGRRDFLRIGSLTLGGLSLPQLLAVRAAARSPGSVAPITSDLLTGRSVIFLFMHGGPSQTETWDPKMTAPDGVRSATGEIPTRLPGITFGSTFPRLAALAHKLAVVRSFTTGDGRHDTKPIVGRDTFDANFGSVYSRVAGTNHPQTGMPTNAFLFPQAIDESTQPPGKGDLNSFGKLSSGGFLGKSYAPFTPGVGGGFQDDLKLSLPMNRLDDRRTLLRRLDQAKGTLAETGAIAGLDRVREQAYRALLGNVGDAFDLAKEDPRTLARYDTASLVRPEAIDKKWNNHNNYADNAKSLGKLLLLARRLCEAGCGFVTVTTKFVWDMHADKNNADMVTGMSYLALPFDHAVSAFIEDTEARGLSDRILLVCCGEMGRTPKINARGGRDHWGNLAPLLLYGGGIEGGQVIGRSTRDVSEPASQPVTIQNLLATILHAQFDVGKLRLQSELPRPLTQTMTSWEPIPGLIA